MTPNPYSDEELALLGELIDGACEAQDRFDLDELEAACLRCDVCGDRPSFPAGSPDQTGQPCGRDMSEELGRSSDSVICTGTYQPPAVFPG